MLHHTTAILGLKHTPETSVDVLLLISVTKSPSREFSIYIYIIYFLFCNGSQVIMPIDIHTVVHLSPYTTPRSASLATPAFLDA